MERMRDVRVWVPEQVYERVADEARRETARAGVRVAPSAIIRRVVMTQYGEDAGAVREAANG